MGLGRCKKTSGSGAGKARASPRLQDADCESPHRSEKGTAFTLDSGHRNVGSGLYYVNTQGETHICLVNETAEEAVIGDSELLGEHVPVKANDMITLGELLTVHSSERTQQAGPSKEKEQLIEETVSGQGHLSQRQQEDLREVLLQHHEAVSLGKSDMGRSTAVPHVLRLKTGEPAYVKQFPIPAAHLHFINEQIACAGCHQGGLGAPA